MKPARRKDIATVYQQALTDGAAFASFRLPHTKKVNFIMGNVSRTLKDNEKAFVIAPFDRQQKPYYIKDAGHPLPKEKKYISKQAKKQKSTTKSQFTGLVKKITIAIEAGDFTKIVAARVMAGDKPVGFDPIALFLKLCDQYAAAFVSLTYIPGVGLWIGASPEVLASETTTGLTTYSLAGTKAIEDKTPWTPKETEEQKIVTDFIYKKLSKATTAHINMKGPVTHHAGRIKHLLSVFTIQHTGKSLWHKVIKMLHPTPAVGGMPQKKAIKFISNEESFERAFYAGYLGPVGWDQKTDVFVNLRCMQVTDRQLLFYAGCGITIGSDPEKEWQESERKVDVIKSLL